MFRGNNTLELNEATVIAAVQEYLDRRTASGCAGVVKSVKHDGSGYSATFKVALEEAAPQAASAA